MIESLTGDAAAQMAVRQVRPLDDVDEALARVAWSVLAEPGDGVAGALIAERGAVTSLGLAVGGGPVASSEVSERGLAEGRARWMVRADARSVLDAIRAAADVGARLLLPGDDLWPSSLDDLGVHAPTVLWVRGDPGLLSAPTRVAIVGARAATGYGEMLAGDFAGELAAAGTVVVSGGAYGIDGAAHRAALGVGGKTVAFLAGGVDRAYPQGHQQLLRRIVETGAVVSEVPCGTAPTKWRFLSRNLRCVKPRSFTQGVGNPASLHQPTNRHAATRPNRVSTERILSVDEDFSESVEGSNLANQVPRNFAVFHNVHSAAACGGNGG